MSHRRTIARGAAGLLGFIGALLPVAIAAADWWQACAMERQQFCQGVEAGGGRVAACLDQHESELSPACKAARPTTSPNSSAPSQNSSSSESPSPGAGDASLPTGYRLVYRTNWQSGLDRGLMFQGPTDRSFEIVAAPGDPSRKVLKVTIRKEEDYSRVANGVPRAEVNFGPRVRFQAGRDYWIAWRTYIPNEFQFDAKQPEGISQIHGEAAQGSPPWGLVLSGSRYQAQLRNGTRVETRDVGDGAADKGRWVEWRLRYRPDATGGRAVTELTKDGAEVLSADGIPNAYPDDNMGYFKLGIYKWWWKERPSDVTERTLYFSDVLIGVK